MKRVRCPECKAPIVFDETRYAPGARIEFACPRCGKSFAIRMGVNKKKGKDAPPLSSQQAQSSPYGYLTVIENVFHRRQQIPLSLGDNVIGHYVKGSTINCPIQTTDPSIDMTHCIINVSMGKEGRPEYVLRDGPSNTGTFVGNVILGNRERRVISDGDLFTIGATSIILHTEG